MFYEGVSEDVLNPKQTEVQTQQQNIKGKGKLLSRVRLFVTPWAILQAMGILQARILEWVAFPFSRGSSQARDRTQVSHFEAYSLPAEPQGRPCNGETIAFINR